MNSGKVLFILAACFASAGFSTGISGLHAVSLLSICASVLAAAFFVREIGLPEGRAWWLIAASTASTVMALIGWKAPNHDEEVMALYGALGALLVLALWGVVYAANHHYFTARA